MEPDCTYRLCGLRTAEQYTEAFETDSEAQKSIEKESVSSSAPAPTRNNPVADKHPSTLSEISVKDLPALVKGEEDLVYIPQSQDRESGKYEIRDTTGKLDFDGALDEVVADGCEMMLKRSSVVSTLARENPSLFDRIHDWLKEWGAKIRKAFSGVEAYHEEAKAMLGYMDQLQKLWDKALTEAARNAQTENESAQIDNESAQNENKLPTEDRKMTASDGGRVQYSSRDEVLATEDVDWMDDFSSIKQQLRTHRSDIETAFDKQPLVEVEYGGEIDAALDAKIMEQALLVGNPSEDGLSASFDRDGITFDFDKSGAWSIRSHASANDGIRAAAIAAPYIAKNGIRIAGQRNHEHTGITTLTYAGPALLNGTLTNVGVVVQFQEDGKPRAVNVETSDGGKFVIKREGAAKRNRGRVDNSPGTTPPRRATSSVVRIPQTTDKSNPQKSERDAEYMQAVNNGNTAKAQRMVDEAARQAGYTKLFYHGSKKGGGFTVFKDWQYFTENKDYAMRYTQRDNPGSLYTVYAKMEHPFDTRDAEAAKIFAEARQELGLGEIQEIASLIVDSW